MSDVFDAFDWQLIADALDMRVEAERGSGRVTLRAEPGGRRIVIDDNIGEFNTMIVEPGGKRWEPDFSVAYEEHGSAIGPVTLAYRIACHAQDRQIDYRVDLDRWPADLARVAALRALADLIENDGEQAAPPLRKDDLVRVSALWEPNASQLAFEGVLRRELEITRRETEAIVAGVWARERPRQFSALGRAIAAAPVVGSLYVALLCQRFGATPKAREEPVACVRRASWLRWHRGQRGSQQSRARAMARRTVARESGKCRSGRATERTGVTLVSGRGGKGP